MIDRRTAQVQQIVYDWMAVRGIDDLIGDRAIADEAIEDLTDQIMEWAGT